MAPTATPRIISMDFSDGRDTSYFRILAGACVKYIVILPDTLERSALLDMPLDFADILPALDYHQDTWTTAHISRDPATGHLKAALSSPTMARVSTVWHPTIVDFTALDRQESLGLLSGLYTWAPRGNTHGTSGTEGPGRTVVAKMARFEWEVPRVELETRIYQRLEGTGLAPRFLGHVHEQGRVVGFLLEHVEGRHAGMEDLPGCRASLGRLHRLGVQHGDTNRHNFIVGRDGGVVLIDFEMAKEDANPEELEAEMARLEAQLVDESGLGGKVASFEDEDEGLDS